MKALNTILLLVLLVSCGDDNFRKVEKLDGFRVLGIQADTPEVAGATSLNLSLILSDIEGAGRTINGTRISCIDPGVGYGAEVSCDHDPTAPVFNFTVNFGAFSANHFTGVITQNVTVPSGVLSGRSSRDQFNGVAYLFIYNFDVDGKTLTGFKRIIVTNRPLLNTNPSMSTILRNGAGITIFPQDGDRLLTDASGAESYTYRTVDNIDETRAEKLQVAWYVSEGELSRSKTYIDESTEYEGRTPVGDSVVVAVVRDDRGGLSFEIFSP